MRRRHIRKIPASAALTSLPFVYSKAPPISDNDVIDFSSFVYIIPSPNIVSIYVIFLSKNLKEYDKTYYTIKTF